MKKRLEKGFTLVELIVVLVLLGLITTCIAMIIKPSNRLYSNVTAKSG
jgi:prepilin-type N-terminal cleavage/methylation domain-containing protein